MPAKVLTFAERQARAARNRALRSEGKPTPHSAPKGAFEPDRRPGQPEEGGNGNSPSPTITGSAKKVMALLGNVPMYTSGYLDKVQEDALCEIIEVGNFPHHAAEALGIPKQNFFDWIRRAKVGEEPYLSLLKRLNSSRAKAVVILVARIRDAADYVSWQAAVRMLESMSMDEWMKTEKRVEDVGSVFKELLMELAEARRGKPPENRTLKTIEVVASTAISSAAHVPHAVERQTVMPPDGQSTT